MPVAVCALGIVCQQAIGPSLKTLVVASAVYDAPETWLFSSYAAPMLEKAGCYDVLVVDGARSNWSSGSFS